MQRYVVWLAGVSSMVVLGFGQRALGQVSDPGAQGGADAAQTERRAFSQPVTAAPDWRALWAFGWPRSR